MVYLCGRPLRNRGRCTLGRETAIQPMVWSVDGWLRTVDGEGVPTLEAPGPALPGMCFLRDQLVRTSTGAICRSSSSGSARRGQTSCSVCRRGLVTCGCTVARRSEASSIRRSSRVGSSLTRSAPVTSVDARPQHFQQAAGLICYYNSAKFHYFYVSRDEQIGTHLRVMSCLPDQVQSDAFTDPIAIVSGTRVHLRVEVDCERLQFGYRLEGEDDWHWVAQHLRREHPVRRGDRARSPELHRRVRRDVLSGSRRNGDARRL